MVIKPYTVGRIRFSLSGVRTQFAIETATVVTKTPTS